MGRIMKRHVWAHGWRLVMPFPHPPIIPTFLAGLLPESLLPCSAFCLNLAATQPDQLLALRAARAQAAMHCRNVGDARALAHAAVSLSAMVQAGEVGAACTHLHTVLAALL